MSVSKPVERVIEFLKNAGYRLLPSPLVIRQSAFEFDAAMMGPQGASDIVLIADTVDAHDSEIVRRILGVARALDLARSRNPLTAILVGPRPEADHLAKMTQVCRVLPVGTIKADPEEHQLHLSNWLAVLTPLDQIDTEGVVADPLAALGAHIEDLSEDVQSLCNSIPDGAAGVEASANRLLQKYLITAWEDDR